MIEEHSVDAAEPVDREAGRGARSCSPVSATPTSAASRGRTSSPIPVGVAKICAGMRLDTDTLCAALLHDTVEDTSASLDEVASEFGDEVADARRRRDEAERASRSRAATSTRRRTTAR